MIAPKIFLERVAWVSCLVARGLSEPLIVPDEQIQEAGTA
jgi:hypothetical protein